MTMTSGPRTFE